MPIIKRHVKLYPDFIRHYNAGLNDREIAEAIGIQQPKTICAWRKRHGLPANTTHRPSKVDPYAEKVVSLRESGLLYREIAVEIGVSKSAIQQFFQKREVTA